MGIYYSLMEWESIIKKDGSLYIKKQAWNKYHIPEQEYVSQHMLPQLKELVTKYQPALIFADGEWDREPEYWQSKEFLAWLYNQAPNKNEVIVNDRWQPKRGEHGGYFTSEYNDQVAKMNAEHPWEENRGMGQSYGFNRAENIDDHNSSEKLIQQLIDIVSRGGNLLLNIGPAADGTIPVIMQQRLVDIGDWLHINGEAIYDTRPWLNQPTQNNTQPENSRYYTTKGKDLYVLCTQWPEKEIELSGIRASKNTKVQLLGNQEPVSTKYKKGVLRIQVPLVSRAQLKSKYAYVFKIEDAL